MQELVLLVPFGFPSANAKNGHPHEHKNTYMAVSFQCALGCFKGSPTASHPSFQAHWQPTCVLGVASFGRLMLQEISGRMRMLSQSERVPDEKHLRDLGKVTNSLVTIMDMETMR